MGAWFGCCTLSAEPGCFSDVEQRHWTPSCARTTRSEKAHFTDRLMSSTHANTKLQTPPALAFQRASTRHEAIPLIPSKVTYPIDTMASETDESKPQVPSLVYNWGSKSTLTLTRSQSLPLTLPSPTSRLSTTQTNTSSKPPPPNAPLLPHSPPPHQPAQTPHPLRRAPPLLLVRQPLGLHHRRCRHVRRVERPLRAARYAPEPGVEGAVLGARGRQGRCGRARAGEPCLWGVGLGDGG